MERKHLKELTDAEIDAVSGGAASAANYGNSLVAINAALANILTHNNVLNNVHVAAAVDVLGGLAAARA